MNFTYLYKDDPDMDLLAGNITWIVPNADIQAHWIHAEYICRLSIFSNELTKDKTFQIY